MAWGIIGHERAVAALRRALAQGRLAHAYLFVGPAQVGRRTMALRLAQALNCTGEEPPCLACPPCRRIAAGLHADVQVITVEAVEEGPQHRDISVRQIREVERAVALKPFEGRFRVVIIDPAEWMNREAQNAFLKTLEEPPPQALFALVAAQEGRLLPTIRSRCQRIELGPLPPSLIQAALSERGVEPERARLLARLSGGRIGWALAAAGDEEALRQRREAMSLARALAEMSLADRLDLAERLAREFRNRREAVLDRIEGWRIWWRDVLLLQCGAQEGITNIDLVEDLRQEASQRDRRQVLRFLWALGEARRHLEENVQPQLALEVLLLEAPQVRSSPVSTS